MQGWTMTPKKGISIPGYARLVTTSFEKGHKSDGNKLPVRCNEMSITMRAPSCSKVC